jgi:5-methylcytosine-specific restriction endonuclease McrA
MDLISRADAIASGLKRYFKGEPCPHGHVSERRVSDFSCLECCRLKGRSAKERERRREYMAAHQRRYRKENPDRIKAYNAKRDKKKVAALRRDARKKNPEPDRIAQRKSFQKHRTKRIAENKAWKAANPDKWRALQKAGKANRRALELAAEGKISKRDVSRLFVLQFGFCAADDCRVDLTDGYHLDHIIPLSRGGNNMLRNLQLLCEPCNLSKNNKTMSEWIAWKAQFTPPLLESA